jgi:basic amino acid/polyamine antiporter, APA family
MNRLKEWVNIRFGVWVSAASPQSNVQLGLWQGVGIVIADTVGAGVFLSTGFMAQDMGPGAIMLAWIVGTVLAVAGARAYGALAQWVPHSGGEYKFLSSLLHPILGFLAGWTSLVVGFSAPVAMGAFTAAAFAEKAQWPLPARPTAALIIVALTAAHAFNRRASARVQDVLVWLKLVVVVGFVVVGVVFGNWAWPTWTPPAATEGFPTSAFMGSLFYVSFAFAGWNAAVYAAAEFRNPERTVPRAMMLGCAVVALLYLFVNWVFVANLTPQQASAVFAYDTERITLGHVVMRQLVGPAGASLMSAVMCLLFLSSVSAMMMMGPHVYAAMARDGVLPQVFAGKPGRPPTLSVVLQGALALVLLYLYEIERLLQGVGATLTLFSALAVAALFKVNRQHSVGKVTLVAATVYVSGAAWMLWFGLVHSPTRRQLWIWLGASLAVGALAYAVLRRGQQRLGTSSASPQSAPPSSPGLD